MSSSIDIRVPPIFQSHQQLGDFVMPTSSYNSFVSKCKKTNYAIIKLNIKYAAQY